MPSEDTVRSQISESQEKSPPEPVHAGTLISDFLPPEPWENNNLLFKPLKSMVFRYGSPSRLIHMVSITLDTLNVISPPHLGSNLAHWATPL